MSNQSYKVIHVSIYLGLRLLIASCQTGSRNKSYWYNPSVNAKPVVAERSIRGARYWGVLICT